MVDLVLIIEFFQGLDFLLEERLFGIFDANKRRESTCGIREGNHTNDHTDDAKTSLYCVLWRIITIADSRECRDCEVNRGHVHLESGDLLTWTKSYPSGGVLIVTLMYIVHEYPNA